MPFERFLIGHKIPLGTHFPQISGLIRRLVSIPCASVRDRSLTICGARARELRLTRVSRIWLTFLPDLHTPVRRLPWQRPA
jgi:hypothetical protein